MSDFARDDMYRHLLVPVDATDLSIDVIASAVDFAASLDARITFFHAVPDHASLSGEVEALWAITPDDYEHDDTGRARELLAKAAAAARAWGVPCELVHTVCDKPAAAIVEAARTLGCDLIFMASHACHGALGMTLASETLDVLMNAGLPVLVAATGELSAPARVIAIIRDEHRSLSAVLHAWKGALGNPSMASDGRAPALIQGMLAFVERFEARHHPKERSVFERLRERTSVVDAELNELDRQDARERLLVAGLAQRVAAVAACTSTDSMRRAIQSLADEVTGYTNFAWDHMGREEAVVVPAARRFLRDSDWADIEAQFDATGAGTPDEEEYRRLFARILDCAR
jgi:nucleotide-binding universal stress UspA family protein/hemerythrin-like domain-containing protein